MSTYYIAGYPVSDELYHHGVEGQSWGRRLYQDIYGRLTDLGRIHYGVASKSKSTINSNGQSPTYGYQSPQQMQSQLRSPSYTGNARQQAAQFQAQVQEQRRRMQAMVEVNDKNSVANTQQNLQNLGYDLKKYGADGKVGDETRSAINAFKRDYGLQQDGKLDIATSRMIEAESKNSLKKGAKGENVTRMQNALKSLGYNLDKYGSDGKFGAETQKALNEFKKAHGLPENGIYDGVTRTAMAKELSVKSTSAPSRNQYQEGLSIPVNSPQQTEQMQPTTVQPVNTLQEPQAETTVQTEHFEDWKSQNEVTNDTEKIDKEKKKSENNNIEKKGKNKTEEILNAIDKYGNQISENHKVLSEAMSKVSKKAGNAIGEAAKKVSSAHRSLVSNISSAANSVKNAADTSVRAYNQIIDTGKNVYAATLRIEKDIQRKSDKLVKQHNKLVSELSDFSKDTRKEVKRTRNGITAFFNGAKSTLERGSNALTSWLGI